MRDDFRPTVAEFIGTFMLVFIGAGAGALGSGGILGVALAHGFALFMIIYVLGAVSGAHINPAITFGVALARKMTWRRAGMYWAAQLAGAIVAAFLLQGLLFHVPRDVYPDVDRLGATELADGVTAGTGFVIEGVLTLFLMMAVFVSGVLGKNGNMAGVAIGSVLVADIMMGGSLTGASMNPARTMGPMIALGDFSDLWVYWAGPLAGAAVGVAAVRYLHQEE